MFGNKKEGKEETTRFYVKSLDDISSLGRVTVLVDRETGVNYLHTWVGGGSSIIPLLDANGDTVVDQ